MASSLTSAPRTSSRNAVSNALQKVLGSTTATPSWLRLNLQKADDLNPDQETPGENLEFMNASLENCAERLFDFFHKRYGGSTGEAVHLEFLLHPPVYTCEQGAKLCQRPMMSCDIVGNPGEPLSSLHCFTMKNLFLKDKKKNFYLLSACQETEVRMKKLKFAKQLSFASPEALREKLGVLPGSVTPFGLLNDTHQAVEFHLDPKVLSSQAGKNALIEFHPNACNATVCMKVGDFVDFMEQETKHKVNVVSYRE